MKQLVIRFISEHGIVSDLIDWETRSYQRLCHTEGLSRDKQSWVGAHAGTGVQARPLNWCKPELELVYALDVADEQYEAAMSWMEGRVGCKYDYLDIVGIMIHDPKMDNQHALICSAFMFEWFLAAGVRLLNVLPQFSYEIDPDRLHLSNLFIGRGIAHL